MHHRDVLLRLRALLALRRVERELDEELAFHVARETHEHLAGGLSPAEARTRALARFGSIPLAADQCRDARGTAFVEALVRDVSYAFRTFSRAPLAAFTIVATIALGLGLVAAVFIVYNAFFLRVDAVQRPGELFAVIQPASPGSDAWVVLKRADYEALRRETSVFVDVFAVVRSVETRVEARAASSALVTGNFFQVLGVHAALGRTFAAGEDQPSGGRPIVFSHRGWIRLFRGDPTVIGRSVRINGVPCEVVGVMPEDFRGLDFVPPDYWAPLALASEFRESLAGREDQIPVADVVGRLKPGISLEQATAALSSWASARTPPTSDVDHPASIKLQPRQGTLSADWLEQVAIFTPIFFTFGLILAIGCANVANLLLARGVSRQREIGIRLSLGASRRRIVRQLLTESVILALAAAVCGYAVSRICLDGALYAVIATMPAEVAEQVSLAAPPADWRVLVFLIAGALVSTVSFGLMPALLATRVEPVRAIRSEVTRDARPGRARQVLIAVQVSASALLLISAGVFLRSAVAASMADPGIRTSDIVEVPMANEPRRAAIIREVTAHPSVAALAASSPSALAAATVDDAAETRSAPVDGKFVTPGYFDLLDIDLIKGRGFTEAERTTDAGVIVVSETAAQRLWPNGDAVGRVLRLQVTPPESGSSREPGAPEPPFRPYAVVGIARDVDGTPVFGFLSFSGVYLPIDPQSPGTSLTLRVHGDPEQARLALLDRLTRVDPALDHEIRTVRSIAGMGTYLLQIAFAVTFVLGGLALALTVSGLFSVLSYLVEQRAREIGVRIALGATTRQIARLVLSQSIGPVGVGLLVGGGLAAGLATVLISLASEIGRTVQVLDPMAYAASLLVIVTACVLAASIPALRAARLDPTATLRQD